MIKDKLSKLSSKHLRKEDHNQPHEIVSGTLDAFLVALNHARQAHASIIFVIENPVDLPTALTIAKDAEFEAFATTSILLHPKDIKDENMVEMDEFFEETNEISEAVAEIEREKSKDFAVDSKANSHLKPKPSKNRLSKAIRDKFEEGVKNYQEKHNIVDAPPKRKAGRPRLYTPEEAKERQKQCELKYAQQKKEMKNAIQTIKP